MWKGRKLNCLDAHTVCSFINPDRRLFQSLLTEADRDHTTSSNTPRMEELRARNGERTQGWMEIDHEGGIGGGGCYDIRLVWLGG